MKTFGVISICVLLYCSSVYGVRYLDPENEAIVIDDSVSEPLDPNVFDPAEESTTLTAEGYCTTLAGFPGRCVATEVCYPYFSYLTQTEEKDYTTGLVEIMAHANQTDACQNEDGSVTGLICCPNYNYGLPNKRPQFSPPPGSGPPSSTVAPVDSSVSEDPKSVNKAKCGLSHFRNDSLINRVVGGREATPGEFPWAVALLNNGQQFCGGSLISQDYILTAAHCVQGLRSTSGVRINIGDHDHSRQDEVRHESRGAAKILYNKGFSMNTLRDDIALIKLSSPVTYTKRIQPICLNRSPVPYDKKADLAGWGKVSNHGRPSATLRTVNMRIIPVAECQRLYQGTGAPSITTNMICSGEKSPGHLKDACNGDSGGPLTYDGAGPPAVQIGVVSFGIGCGDKPGVYTSVLKYLDWIERNAK